MRVPLPTVQQSVSGNGEYSAPATTPRPDATGRQLQELGNGMQQLGVAGFNLGARLQNEVDIATVERADSIASEAFQRHLYDPKTGFLNTIGVDAVTGDRRQKTFDSLDEEMKRIEGGLSNERQRQDFSRVRDHRMQEAQAKADAHVTKETRTYAYGSAIARAESAANDAQNNVGSPVLFAGYRQIMLDSVNKAADVQGLSTDQRKLLVLGTTTKLHSNIVKGMVDTGRSDVAKTYLDDAVKTGEVAPVVAADLQGLVRTASVSDESLRLAQELAVRGEPFETQQQWLDVAFQQGKVTADVYDATMGRLKGMARDKAAVEVAASNAAVASAEAWALNNKNQPIQALPADIYRSLEKSGELDKMTKFFDEGRWTTTPEGMGALLSATNAQLRAIPSAAAVVKQFRGVMDNGNLKEMVNRWKAANGVQDPQSMAETDRTLLMQVYAKRAGILPSNDNTPSGQQTTDYQNYQLRVDAAVRASVGDKKPTSADYETVMKRLEADSFKVGWGGGRTVLTAFATKEQLQSGWVAAKSGRTVYLESIVDQREAILKDIAHYNDIQRSKNLPTVPETMQTVVDWWDEWQTSVRAQRAAMPQEQSTVPTGPNDASLRERARYIYENRNPKADMRTEQQIYDELRAQQRGNR